MKQIYLFVLLLQVCSYAVSQPVTEAIHLHLDKDSYLPGETIWFKAYLYNGTGASVLSTNLYAALYTAEGKLLQQKQYPLFEGSSNGDFSIPDYVEGNSLQLLVFTKGMRLHDSANNYYRRITVINQSTQSNITSTEKENTQLQFFAEGGTAVAGVTNYYVYRAQYSSGKSAQIKGVITETGNNAVIDSFYTNQQGLGSIQFIPLPGKTYQAVWTDENGQQQVTALPAAVSSGAALHAEVSGNTLYYVISKNSTALQDFSITISNAQTVLYSAMVQMNEINKYVGKVPVDSLTPGLMKITLQDDAKKMLEERMVLVNVEKSKPLVTQTFSNNAPKTKNTVEIVLPDTLLYNLSASISDINFYDSSVHQNIQNSFWLKNDHAVTAASLEGDWLLQANAFTPYRYAASLQPADNYLNLSVNYKEKNFALPQKERLNLMIKDSIAGNQFYDLAPVTPTSFIKTGLVFYDSAKVFYKTTLTKELENYITLQRDEPVYIPNNIAALTNTDPGIAAFTRQKNAALDSFIYGITRSSEKFNTETTLRTVTVQGKKWGSPETRRLLELDEKYATGMFSGIARGFQINVLDDDKAWSAIDLQTYIRNKVPGVTLKYDREEAVSKIYLLGTQGSVNSENAALLFINEVESTYGSLQVFSMDQVAYIKVISGILVGSSFTTGNGAVFIYLKKGNEPQRSILPQMRSKMMKGYDLPKQYSTPDFTKNEQLRLPDFRTTLYWNPYLNTEADKKTIKIDYYNNDVSKKLLLVVEGINEEGKLIHIEKVIEN